MTAVHSTKHHAWDISLEEARSIQVNLRRKVRLRPLALRNIRHVAGADVAVSRKTNRLVAAVVVMTFPQLDVVDTYSACTKPLFPYIPGYLSFREIPAIMACLERVKIPFDVMLCDAQGIAHPRHLGLASHLGLLLARPTIGCAKSRLVGEYAEPGPRRSEFSRLVHGGRTVGSVLRTRDSVKPIFVSPGHLMDHASSRRITLACLTRYRLPEPTRRAHLAAGEAKRSIEEKNTGV